ncbi:diguanylate cyclase domain-containing protein [Salinicola aestuarinus]|uniref:diguanylate cyclase domain-containing protein n=1 Tax=Salinicola aestuarinus TaxID=1949082 RepID=UPI000DA1CA3D|nr:diguanylate cyclase [Salinicola aestuarinus]
MAVSRTRRLAQGLALMSLVALAIWHYLLRHYDLILPPALLAIALLVSIPLQRLGRLRQPLADYLLLIGVFGLFAIEAPNTQYGMLWLGLPVATSFLLLTVPLALTLSLFTTPAWLALLGDTQLTLVNLGLGWWMSLATATVAWALARRQRRDEAALNPRRHGLGAAELTRALEMEVSRAQALAKPLSVLVLYVPQLEHVNDQFGNRLRQTLSETFIGLVADNSRHSDFFGEPQSHVFWLIMPNADEAGAAVAGRRLAEAVSTIERPESGALESVNRICSLRSEETALAFAQRLQLAANKLLEPNV